MPLLLLLGDFLFNSYQFPLRQFAVTVVVAAVYITINQIITCSGDEVYSIYGCGNVWIPIVALVICAVAHAIGYLTWRFWRKGKI